MPSLRSRTLELLRRHGLRPSRSLGQSFLIDGAVMEEAVQSADVGPQEVVLEVGAGLGFLTELLARRAGRVVAVELDRELVPLLRERLSGCANLTIVEGDILTLDLATLLAGVQPGGYKVVANLPYYITSPTLRLFLEKGTKPALLVVMVQLEVAQRLVARPGEMSLLTVSVQFYGFPAIVRKVPASSFYPRPEVDSALVRIEVYPQPPYQVEDVEGFFRVVAAGFSQPRKQLHNSLSQRIWMPTGAAKVYLGEAGIAPERRAETLSIEEWVALYRVLRERLPGAVGAN